MLAAASATPLPTSQPIDTILRAEPDWTRVVEMALHHRVAPSLLAVLDTADRRLIPVDLLAALRAHCETQRAMSQAIIDELWALLGVLGDQGIKAIPFKGPLLGELLFGDFRWRSPGDIDLLVRRGDVAAVRAVLEARGYVDAGRGHRAQPLTTAQREIYERFQCEYQFIRHVDEMVVEPHWELSQRALAIEVGYEGMLGRARPATARGRSFLALAPEDLLVALCVHGAKHQWQRLAWIRDVAGLLAAYPDLDLGRILHEADERGYRRLMLLSLAVARDYGGAVLPTSIARQVESDTNLVSLLDDIGRQTLDPDAPEPRNDKIEPFRVRLRERAADRLKYRLRTVFTPRRQHLEVVRLPVGLTWGYYLIKIGIDYAAAPAWRALGRLAR